MQKSIIKGLGYYVPENVVTNKDLTKMMDTSDEWIRERTGIEERRYGKNRSSCAQHSKRLQKAHLKFQHREHLMYTGD